MQLKLTSPQIYLATRAVDFRRSIDGLCEIIQSNFSLDIRESIFIFFNCNRKKVKILTWHKNGFILIYKRLEKGSFRLCQSDDGLVALDGKQLSWLLAGLDWVCMSDWNELEFDNFY